MFRWIVGIVGVLVVAGGAGLFAAPAIVESGLNKVEPHAPYKVSAAARALHARLNLADLHSDTLLWARDVLARGTTGHVDVPRLREGRFALQVFSAVTKSPQGQNYNRTTGDSDQISLLVKVQLWPMRTWGSLLERALYQAQRLNDAAARDPKALMVVRSRGDLAMLMARRSNGEPMVGGVLAIEGAHALEGDLANVKKLKDAGYRMIGLLHFFDNELGGSLHGESKGGLTPFGVQAVHAIEEAGMIVDVAHASEKVVDDVLQIATRPIVVSHTGVRGACNSPRNLSDAQMRAIAAKGGVIGIGYWDGAVCDTTPAGVAKSLRYAIDLVGVDHVALGSDYDGTTTVRFDASESAALIDAMLAAKFSEDEIRKVTGETALRFLAQNLPQ
ncbi:MAG: dipeptidase [Alphaproteobacteria bacterium]|nr:dipeptidase [Alphaproteobacteria bacterium]